MALQPSFVTTVNNGAVKFTSGMNAHLGQNLIIAGNNGTWVRAVNVYSSCVTDNIFEFSILSGAQNYVLGRAEVPANAGKVGPPLNIMDPAFIPAMDPHPNRGIILAAGETLQAKLVDTGYRTFTGNIDEATWVIDSGSQLDEARIGVPGDAIRGFGTIKSYYSVEEGYLIVEVPKDTAGYLILATNPSSANTRTYTYTRRARFQIGPVFGATNQLSVDALVTPQGYRLILIQPGNITAGDDTATWLASAGANVYGDHVGFGVDGSDLAGLSQITISSTGVIDVITDDFDCSLQWQNKRVPLIIFERPTLSTPVTTLAAANVASSEAQGSLPTADTVDMIAFGGDF